MIDERICAGLVFLSKPCLVIVNQAKRTRDIEIYCAITEKNIIAGHVSNVPLIERNRVLITYSKQRSGSYFLFHREICHHTGNIMTTDVKGVSGFAFRVGKRV